MAYQDEESRAGGVCHLLWDRLGGVGGGWGKCWVMAVSGLSVTPAKWDCRYEEGSNYSDDMMGDPGVIQSHYHRLHSALQGVYVCVCVRVCVNIPLGQFSLRALALSYVLLPQWVCPRPL